VLDVFTGLGLDRRAGDIVHHCTRFGAQPPTRAASARSARRAARAPRRPTRRPRWRCPPPWGRSDEK
jgi:hypothetical protein